MLREERFARIIEYLKINHTAKVNQLADLNKVSVDTVRRDLEILEDYGALKRVRGGAALKQDNMERSVYEMRLTLRNCEKVQLAALVTEVLEEGQTVVIGSGSTTAEIAKAVAMNYKRLTVITNDMDIVQILSHKENFNLIVLGGLFDAEENATYGEQCEEEIRQYNADVCILAVNSISLEKGFSDFRLNQVDALRCMIDISDKVVIAADSSKFDRTASVTLCPVDRADVIITDSKLPPDKKKEYERAGVEIIMPEIDEEA